MTDEQKRGHVLMWFIVGVILLVWIAGGIHQYTAENLRQQGEMRELAKVRHWR